MPFPIAYPPLVPTKAPLTYQEVPPVAPLSVIILIVYQVPAVKVYESPELMEYNHPVVLDKPLIELAPVLMVTPIPPDPFAAVPIRNPVFPEVNLISNWIVLFLKSWPKSLYIN